MRRDEEKRKHDILRHRRKALFKKLLFLVVNEIITKKKKLFLFSKLFERTEKMNGKYRKKEARCSNTKSEIDRRV